MRNRNNSGVVEDIWMNTQVGIDDREHPDKHDLIDPNSPDSPSDWEDIEEANALLNPDVAGMDRG